MAVAVIAAATGIGWPLHRALGMSETNMLMLYLFGVLCVAIRLSRSAAILAAVLGVLAFDFVFVPPYYTLDVHDPQYLVTFAVMLFTALTVSTLTHRGRARANEARVAWEAAESEFLRNTLLSGVSHDLRTPLSAITGSASTLIEMGDTLSPETRADMLDTIYLESERMERLIRNLLDMTRLESGGVVLKRAWQPLEEVVGSALRHLERRLKDRLVTVDLPADLPLVHIDEAAIEQVLVNLIDNAVEHTPPSTPIEIGAAITQDGVVAVTIADRGAGVAPDIRGRVFDKFFRARCTESGRRGSGVGLGLAICRTIVQAHGGTIGVGDRPGGGAAFRFNLPVVGRPPPVDSST